MGVRPSASKTRADVDPGPIIFVHRGHLGWRFDSHVSGVCRIPNNRRQSHHNQKSSLHCSPRMLVTSPSTRDIFEMLLRKRHITGIMSQWLYSALAEAGLPVICVETRHMRAV